MFNFYIFNFYIFNYFFRCQLGALPPPTSWKNEFITAMISKTHAQLENSSDGNGRVLQVEPGLKAPAWVQRMKLNRGKPLSKFAFNLLRPYTTARRRCRTTCGFACTLVGRFE